MKKTTEQIAKDCGMLDNETKCFRRVMNQTNGSVEPYPAVLEDIIGALYRRIEKLEEEKTAAYLEMVKVTPGLRAVFDRAVWDAARDSLDAGPRKGV